MSGAFGLLKGITLVPRGFLIPRCAENNWLLQRALRELTFEKKESFGKAKYYQKKEPPLYLFVQSPEYVLVPKFWLLPIIRGKGVQVTQANLDGEPIAVQYREDCPLFEDRRRPQQSAARYALEKLQTDGGVLLQLPVGCGKTNLSLFLVAACGSKTLWLSHRHNLNQQAAERAREFIPGVRIGWLYADVFDIENKDIVFATVQSIGTKPTYTPELFKQFGTVVLDEGHHAAAPLFVNALFRIAAPRMIALTANPNRDDGLDEITYSFFSHNKFVVEPTLPDGISLHLRVYCLRKRSLVLEPDMCDSDFWRKENRKKAAELKRAQLLTESGETEREKKEDDISDLGLSALCTTVGRIAAVNALGVALVKKALVTKNADEFDNVSLEEMQDTEFLALPDRERMSVLVEMRDTGEIVPIAEVCHDVSRVRKHMQQYERQVMVSFFHKSHIDHFFLRLQRSGVPEKMIGRYYGECAEDQRAFELQKRIVLMTYAMAEEGLDVATANTLVMMGPRGKSSLQTVGRVLRDKMIFGVQPLVCHMHHAWCELDNGLYYKRCLQFHRYPFVERVFEIGERKAKAKKAVKKKEAAQQGGGIEKFFRFVSAEDSASATNSVSSPMDAVEEEAETKSAETESAAAEEDPRINEVGAISVPKQRAKPGEAKKKRPAMSKDEKAERLEQRKKARRDIHLSDLQYSVDEGKRKREEEEEEEERKKARLEGAEEEAETEEGAEAEVEVEEGADVVEKEE